MKANRRIRAYDISNSRFLSKTFIVAMIRHGGHPDHVGVWGASTPDGTIEMGSAGRPA
jgi:hypothetical protein